MNGYVVTLRGALTATMMSIPVNGQPIPKFETLTFDANHHDKMISLDAIIGTRQADPTLPPTPRQGALTTTANGTDGSTANTPAKKEEVEPKVMVEQAIMPAEPVNAFGIPQATMRCLEVCWFRLLYLRPFAESFIVSRECSSDVGSDTIFERE